MWKNPANGGVKLPRPFTTCLEFSAGMWRRSCDRRAGGPRVDCFEGGGDSPDSLVCHPPLKAIPGDRQAGCLRSRIRFLTLGNFEFAFQMLQAILSFAVI